jgi:hypothetical protein
MILTGRGDGKQFVAHAGEKLTAFLELESAIRKIALTLSAGRAESRPRHSVVQRVILGGVAREVALH